METSYTAKVMLCYKLYVARWGGAGEVRLTSAALVSEQELWKEQTKARRHWMQVVVGKGFARESARRR